MQYFIKLNNFLFISSGESVVQELLNWKYSEDPALD